MSEVLLYEKPNVFSVDATSKTLYFILPFIISKIKREGESVTPHEKISCTECTWLITFNLENASETLMNASEYEVDNYLNMNKEQITSYILSIIDEDTIDILIGGTTYLDAEKINEMIYSVLTDPRNSHARYVAVNIPYNIEGFSDIVKFLIHNNFGSPKILNKTVTGTLLEKSVITLFLVKGNLNVGTPINILNYVYELVYSIEPYDKSCKFIVLVPLKEAKKLHELLSRDTEYGGSFYIRKYNLFKDTQKQTVIPVAELGLAESTLTKGDKASVMPTLSLFNFHTHPYHCYEQNGCTLNLDWFSPADVSAITNFRNMQKTILHFLISKEGIYTIQLTPEFSTYLDELIQNEYINYEDCYTSFMFVLKERFKSFEDIILDVNYEHIPEYLTNINNIMFSSVLSETYRISETSCDWLQPEKDFRLFNITFTFWKDIEKQGYLSVQSHTVHPKGVGCPPSILHEKQFFSYEDYTDL